MKEEREPMNKMKPAAANSNNMAHQQFQRSSTNQSFSSYNKSSIVILSVILIVSFINGACCMGYTHGYTHHAVMDPESKYHLYWRVDHDREKITFWLEVQTKGWIGLGISPSGGMAGADIALGWVSEDGKVYFQDRYATGESVPLIDESQDWELLYGYENETHTVLKVVRPFRSCDDKYDQPITRDTIRVIWAYDDMDPESEFAILQHRHTRRGRKSMYLLEDPKPSLMTNLEQGLDIWQLGFNDMTVPNEPSSWSCALVKAPYRDKRHIVRFDPIITPGNEPLIHHMALYQCQHPEPYVLEQYLHKQLKCDDIANMPPDMAHCQTMYMVWANGGGPVILPRAAGLPIADDPETTYFLFEIHYDNPSLVKDRKDNSGLRVYTTPNLRPNDAYTLAIGSTVDYRLLIPPGQNEWKIVGHCDSRCLEENMPSSGINIFAAFPHAHLLGRRIKTRHFRGDEELEPLEDERAFDFNFQEYKFQDPPRRFFPGDQMTVECTYNSSARTRATLGGLQTRDEMCIEFIMYYPRLKGTKVCMSANHISTITGMASIGQLYDYDLGMDPVIKSPARLRNQSLSKYLREKSDWDDGTVKLYSALMVNSKHTPQCHWRPYPNAKVIDDLISYPNPLRPWNPPRTTCISADFEPRAFYSFDAPAIDLFPAEPDSAHQSLDRLSPILIVLIACFTLILQHH